MLFKSPEQCTRYLQLVIIIVSWLNVLYLPCVWLEDNDVNADVPNRVEEWDLIDKDDFLFDRLSEEGEGERFIPTDALTFCTWSILLKSISNPMKK